MSNLDTILQHLLKRPYVVDSGEDEHWTYKKWSDGSCELRSTFLTTRSYAVTASYGSMYMYASFGYFHTPFALIDYANSQVFVSIEGSGTDFAGACRMKDEDNPIFSWLNPRSYTAGPGATIQVVIYGKWK